MNVKLKFVVGGSVAVVVLGDPRRPASNWAR